MKTAASKQYGRRRFIEKLTRAGVIPSVPCDYIGRRPHSRMHGIFNGPAGNTDFWNQPRVTGSPRASIIAAISGTPALLFSPLDILARLVSPSPFSRSGRICFPFSFSFPSHPSFSSCTLPFSATVSTVRIVQLIAGKWEASPRAIVFHFVEAKESRVDDSIWEISFRDCDCAPVGNTVLAEYYVTGHDFRFLTPRKMMYLCKFVFFDTYYNRIFSFLFIKNFPILCDVFPLFFETTWFLQSSVPLIRICRI